MLDVQTVSLDYSIHSVIVYNIFWCQMILIKKFDEID